MNPADNKGWHSRSYLPHYDHAPRAAYFCQELTCGVQYDAVFDHEN